MENQMKMVEFNVFCKTCKHKELGETKDPCNECLGMPFMPNTSVPAYWEEKK